MKIIRIGLITIGVLLASVVGIYFIATDSTADMPYKLYSEYINNGVTAGDYINKELNNEMQSINDGGDFDFDLNVDALNLMLYERLIGINEDYYPTSSLCKNIDTDAKKKRCYVMTESDFSILGAWIELDNSNGSGDVYLKVFVEYDKIITTRTTVTVKLNYSDYGNKNGYYSLSFDNIKVGGLPFISGVIKKASSEFLTDMLSDIDVEYLDIDASELSATVSKSKLVNHLYTTAEEETDSNKLLLASLLEMAYENGLVSTNVKTDHIELYVPGQRFFNTYDSTYLALEAGIPSYIEGLGATSFNEDGEFVSTFSMTTEVQKLATDYIFRRSLLGSDQNFNISEELLNKMLYDTMSGYQDLTSSNSFAVEGVTYNTNYGIEAAWFNLLNSVDTSLTEYEELNEAFYYLELNLLLNYSQVDGFDLYSHVRMRAKVTTNSVTGDLEIEFVEGTIGRDYTKEKSEDQYISLSVEIMNNLFSTVASSDTGFFEESTSSLSGNPIFIISKDTIQDSFGSESEKMTVNYLILTDGAISAVIDLADLSGTGQSGDEVMQSISDDIVSSLQDDSLTTAITDATNDENSSLYGEEDLSNAISNVSEKVDETGDLSNITAEDVDEITNAVNGLNEEQTQELIDQFGDIFGEDSDIWSLFN